jgi:hypothetical protein
VQPDEPALGSVSRRLLTTAMVESATLLRDRPRPQQILLGGVVPALVGVLAGVLVGASAVAYYVIALLAGIGAFLSGFEHRDGWGGADRGFFGGAIYGTALLLMHAAVGTHAKVSLGSFPPLLAVLTAVIGMFLAAGGGKLARLERERLGLVPRQEEEY